MSRRVNRTRLYVIWTVMKQRCFNPRVPGFKNYGARGIVVCRRWRDSFEAFSDDMGPPPEGTSIDRRDNARGYDCGRCEDCAARGAVANCRWATDLEQNRNRRDNRRITHQGETLCVSEWEERLGLPKRLVTTRLRRGWTEAAALTTPVRVPLNEQRTCARCGASFRLRSDRVATAKFCSRKCANRRATFHARTGDAA